MEYMEQQMDNLITGSLYNQEQEMKEKYDEAKDRLDAMCTVTEECDKCNRLCSECDLDYSNEENIYKEMRKHDRSDKEA